MIGVGNSLANVNEGEFDGISFNGSSDFMEVAYPAGRVEGGTTDLTISFWAKLTDTGATEYIVSQQVNTNYYWYVGWHSTSDKPTFFCRITSGVWANIFPTNAVIDSAGLWDKWTHYCVTIDASEETGKWYINGQSVPTTAVIDNTKVFASLVTGVFFGRKGLIYGGPFKLLSFALWNVHVSDADVAKMYDVGPQGLLNAQNIKTITDGSYGGRQCYFVFSRKHFQKQINGGAANGVNAWSGWFENLAAGDLLAWQTSDDCQNQELSESNFTAFSNNDCDNVTIDGKNFVKITHTDAGHDLVMSFAYLDSNHITHDHMETMTRANTFFVINFSYYVDIPSGADFQISMGNSYISFNKDTIEQTKVHTANVVCSNSTGSVPFWVLGNSPATGDYVAFRINSVKRFMGATTQWLEPKQLLTALI